MEEIKLTGKKPTTKQIAFLSRCNIIPPQTKKACSSLISYIIQGNGTIGKDKNDRIAITKSYQKKWLGKRVRNKGEEIEKGVVVHLVAFWFTEVMIFQDDKIRLHPFQAVVHFPSRKKNKTSVVFLSTLEKIDE